MEWLSENKYHSQKTKNISSRVTRIQNHIKKNNNNKATAILQF